MNPAVIISLAAAGIQLIQEWVQYNGQVTQATLDNYTKLLSQAQQDRQNAETQLLQDLSKL